MSFDRAYKKWSYIHAGIVTILAFAVEAEALRLPGGVALTLWTPLALARLFHLGRRLHPDGPGPALPNLLTSARILAATALLGLFALDALQPEIGEALRGGAGWYLMAALLLVEVTDFFDGYLARRFHSGGFGVTWDMESDAIYALSLTLMVRHLHEGAGFVLAIGLMRYVYVLLWREDATLPGVAVERPRVQQLYSKTTTAVLVTALIVVMAPVVGATLQRVTLGVVLAMQLFSFGWDMALQIRAWHRQGRPA